nr:hypothetical protein CFP56_23625 [Quercus suber]
MVVAIDDSEHSTYALEWTLHHFFTKHRRMKLVLCLVANQICSYFGKGIFSHMTKIFYIRLTHSLQLDRLLEYSSPFVIFVLALGEDLPQAKQPPRLFA